MTDATSILNCEVWQMGHPETDIEAALLKIYRTLLGVEAKTATDGLRQAEAAETAPTQEPVR